MLGKLAATMLLVLSLEGMAEPSAPAPPDFSAGFQRLIDLGLPSLEGAEWWTTGGNNRTVDNYELQDLLQDLKGGGWKVQRDGKPAFLPLGGLEVIEMPTAPAGGGGLLGAIFGGGSKKPKAMDPVADANKLIETLAAPEKGGSFRSQLEYRGTGALGPLLIFATQLHQSGHPSEANRLASQIFNLGLAPESIIDSAVNRLADRDLEKVGLAFKSSHDWAAYERDLKQLTARYPRGWEYLPAVKMLLPKLARKVANTPPPKIVMPGLTLNPEAVAALEEVLTVPEQEVGQDAIEAYARENGYPVEALNPQIREMIRQQMSRSDSDSGGPWLIGDPPNASAKDPWSRLKRLGPEALPALAAVVADDTLTSAINSGSSSRSGRFSFGETGVSEADLAIAAYESMERPMTRGELACRFLRSTLPGEDLSEADPEALAEAAVQFWKAHRGKSKLDLLLVFVTEGGESMKSTAMAKLAEWPDPAARTAFERLVLESDDATGYLSEVATYLKTHKATAKDFFVKYSAFLRSQLEGLDASELRSRSGYEVQQAGGVEPYLKKLSLFVGGESPRKLLRELAKADKPDKQQIRSLAETILESSKDEFVPIFLEACVSAKSAETRSEFLGAIFTGTRERNQTDDEETDRKDLPVPASLIPGWTTLLKDDREIRDGTTVSYVTTYSMEQAYSRGTMDAFYQISQIDPDASRQLLKSRAEERLAAKPLTPVPDASKLPAGRLDELLKPLSSAKPEAVHELVEGWKLEEKCAYQDWLSEKENLPRIPASVLSARTILIAPKRSAKDAASTGDQDIAASLDLKAGTKLDFDRLVSTASKVASNVKDWSGLSLDASASPLNTGCVVSAVRVFDEKRGGKDDRSVRLVEEVLNSLQSSSGEEEGAVVIAWVDQERSSWKQVMWKVKAGKASPPSDEELQPLRMLFQSADQPDGSAPSLTLSALHRDDLEKLNKLRSNLGSSDE